MNDDDKSSNAYNICVRQYTQYGKSVNICIINLFALKYNNNKRRADN